MGPSLWDGRMHCLVTSQHRGVVCRCSRPLGDLCEEGESCGSGDGVILPCSV